MTGLIRHHHDFSPFAEKTGLAFGLKGLAWRSVTQPSCLPKPELVPLTGGYRHIPVMQAGADVWCDTRCIARELERRQPAPALMLPALAPLGSSVSVRPEGCVTEAVAGELVRVDRCEALLVDRKGGTRTWSRHQGRQGGTPIVSREPESLP